MVVFALNGGHGFGVSHDRGTVLSPQRTCDTAYVSLNYSAGWSLVDLSPLVLPFPHFSNFYCILNLVCVCVCMRMHSSVRVYLPQHGWRTMNNLGSRFSPFTTWAPGIELMPAGLAASIFTHRVISTALVSLPFVGTTSFEALSPAQIRGELVILG